MLVDVGECLQEGAKRDDGGMSFAALSHPRSQLSVGHDAEGYVHEIGIRARDGMSIFSSLVFLRSQAAHESISFDS